MSIRLIYENWEQELAGAVARDPTCIRIICPFIKTEVIRRLISEAKAKRIEVITRLDCRAFYQRVSDLEALRMLAKKKAKIRSLAGVHAKVYLIGERAIVTSANLTDKGLSENAEFGFVSDDPSVVNECQQYFSRLWQLAGDDVMPALLDECQRTVAEYTRSNGEPPRRSELPDKSTPAPKRVRGRGMGQSGHVRAFVKFWGNSDKGGRFPLDTLVMDDVAHAGSHKVATYPRAPRQNHDDDVIFMGRLVRGSEKDIIIQGRAIGRAHNSERGVASKADIAKRDWREHYKYYVRLRDPEFIAGTLADGISFNELMKALKHLSFRSTKDRYANGERGINPSAAYSQQPQIQLSEEAYTWLNERLDRAFAEHGKLTDAQLASIDNGYPYPRHLDREIR